MYSNQVCSPCPTRANGTPPDRVPPLGLFIVVLLIPLVFGACRPETSGPLFVRLDSDATGVSFVNLVEDDTTFNMLTYLYFYDGGGIAAGDVNNDGLVDLYFTANLLPNRLYLNRGNLVFEDVTETAGVAGEAFWATGVTMADVNGDGFLDIYVSTSMFPDKKSRNELFINNGDGTFDELAADFGLDYRGYSTQAAFFDYDLDGDLDVYLLNHSTHLEESFGLADTLRDKRHPSAGDKLFRNDANRFIDVSKDAGIYGSQLGYGLGVVVSDLDVDGCPDLFVANDFHEHDYLYYNNCDGTFEERIARSTGLTSRASMGVDAADFNNDGLPDIFVLDMLPDRQEVVNTSFSTEALELYNLQRRFGYHHQVMRNTLQLNRGDRRFSEIAFLAGVPATDWSWTPLFCDLDNDGYKDLFVTNGIFRRPNDRDFIRAISSRTNQSILERGLRQEDMGLVELMPEAPGVNYAFRNEGNLTFSNVSSSWGLDESGYSSGAVYADLDNDGDLDLVLNNLNTTASIYENRTNRLLDHHSLTISLRGDGPNTFGIGTKVFAYTAGLEQLVELSPTRGFQSSVDPRIHIGLGTAEIIDSLRVVWPDGRYQELTGVAVDTALTLRQREATGAYLFRGPAEMKLFEDVTARVSMPYRHDENKFVDFNRERLIPHMLSTEGPALAVGDVNGDGRDDLFVGGAKHQAGSLLIQRPDGTFESFGENTWRADSLHEDVDAVFFDADSDGDLDLFVVSGGNEFWGQHDALRDRLYLNDGDGRFSRSESALPEYFANGCCVALSDFDLDGDLDLFVGSRVISRQYGAVPNSFLLENDGTGRFTDVSGSKASDLTRVGMVTDAVWADVNGDHTPDLIVVGEWMPIKVFMSNQGRLTDQTESAGFGGTLGWWNAVAAADLDGDGDMDLIAGNLGRNSLIQAFSNEPVHMMIKDVDGNGEDEHLITTFRNEGRFLLATPDELFQQVPRLFRKYPSYTEFGAGRLEEVFSTLELEGAVEKEARMLYSIYAENQGDGTFRVTELPVGAQMSPVFAILTEDFNLDGRMDVLLGGNFFGVRPQRGRYTASFGTLLLGSGTGVFREVSPHESGLYIDGQVRDMATIDLATEGFAVVIARNDDRLQVINILSPR